MDFEQNRREMLVKLMEMKKKKKSSPPVRLSKSAKAAAKSAPKVEKKKVVVFATRSKFRDSLVGALSGKYEAHVFDNSDKAINFAMDNNIKLFVLDLDEPTDWRMSTDVFTNVRTMDPSATFVVAAALKTSSFLDPLVAQGALYLRKPIQVAELHKMLG